MREPLHGEDHRKHHRSSQQNQRRDRSQSSTHHVTDPRARVVRDSVVGVVGLEVRARIELSPQQPGSATPVFAVIPTVPSVIMTVLASVAAVIATIFAPVMAPHGAK
jgi:hypothetical protein